MAVARQQAMRRRRRHSNDENCVTRTQRQGARAERVAVAIKKKIVVEEVDRRWCHSHSCITKNNNNSNNKNSYGSNTQTICAIHTDAHRRAQRRDDVGNYANPAAHTAALKQRRERVCTENMGFFRNGVAQEFRIFARLPAKRLAFSCISTNFLHYYSTIFSTTLL